MTQTRLERTLIEAGHRGARAKFSQGYMSRLVYGERGTSTIDPLKLQAISDTLGVSFEWLATGREPMRPQAIAHAPPELGAMMARSWGALEDAVEHVLARETYAEEPWQTPKYYFDLIMAENAARRSAGMAEFPATKQAETRRAAEKAREAAKPQPSDHPPVHARRRAGGE